MSVVKSYSDARKELERIANQRKHFLNNSKALREDMVDSTPHTSNSYNRASVDRYSQITTGGSSYRFAGTPHTPYTPHSASQGHNSSHHPQNQSQNRNQSQPAHTSSSAYNMTPASYRKDSERIERTIPYSSPVSQPVFQNVTSPGLGTASSVIGAFRQLQAKSRKVELERSEAIKERDELQRQVSENLRAQELFRSQSETQTTESFQAMKAASDQLMVARRGIELSLLSLQEVHSSTQRSNSTDRAVLLSLETERGDIRAIQHTVKCNIKALEAELAATTARCSSLSSSSLAASLSTSSPSSRIHQAERLQASVLSTQNQVESVQRATELTRMRCSALERYMELVLKINGDLTKRISDTAGARAHMRELAERLTPPRYAWPKELNHDCISSIVSEVAAEKTIQDNAARIALAAKAALRKDKGRRPSSAPPRGATNPKRNGRANDDNGDVQIDLEKNWGLGPGVLGSMGSIGGSRGSIGRDGVRFDLDAAYRALSADPRRRSSSGQLRSSHNISTNNSHNNYNGSNSSNSSNGHKRCDARTSSSQSSDRRHNVSKNPIRQVKCRGTSVKSPVRVRNDVTAHLSPGTKSSRSPSRPLRSSQSTYTGEGGGGGRGGGGLDGGRAPVTFMVLDGTDSLYNQAVSAAAAAALGVPKGENRGFIPGGNTEAKEFNVVAKGSKIARATTHFNAAVAARVKAYKKDMIGEDLIDMMM